MATWKPENSMLTQRGVEILNKIKAGVGSINVTRVVAGSNRVAESQLYAQTTISGSILNLNIASKSVFENGSEISLQITNEGITTPFTINQLGVYVTHPDYVGEQLYHISQCDSVGADVIPSVETTPVTFGYSLFLEHGNSSSVTIEVSSQGFVTTPTFNAFKGNLQTDLIVSTDSAGNLKSSGKRNVSADVSLVVNDAIAHRALSVSITGDTTQETPTVSLPKPFVDTKVFDIRTKGTGKNLFDVHASPLKVAGEAYGAITTTLKSMTAAIVEGATNPYLGYLIPVTVGTAYKFIFNLVNNSSYTYIQLDNPISEITSSEFGSQLNNNSTITATKPYFLICVKPTYIKSTYTYGIEDFIMVGGSDKTSPYESFVGSTVVLPSAIDLCSVNGYQDSIEFDGSKWWRVQRIKELVVDGVNTKVSSSSSTTNQYYTRLRVATANDAIVKGALPNVKMVTTRGNTVADTSEFYAYSTNSGEVGLHFLSTTFGVGTSQSVSGRVTTLNTWLANQNTAGNPVKVRYVLDTPIVTEIPVNEIAEMFESYTKVSVTHLTNLAHIDLGYAINTTDPTIMYILQSLARKSDIQTANTFATASILVEPSSEPEE